MRTQNAPQHREKPDAKQVAAENYREVIRARSPAQEAAIDVTLSGFQQGKVRVSTWRPGADVGREKQYLQTRVTGIDGASRVVPALIFEKIGDFPRLQKTLGAHDQ